MALETAVIVTGDGTTPAPAEVPTAPVRDDQGRFAPTTPGEPTPPETPAAAVPSEPVEPAGDAPPATPDTPPEPPKKGSPQFRINQAIAKQREAERRAQELTDRLAALERPAAPEPVAPPPPPSPHVPDPNMPREDQFETWEAFTEAKVTYLAEKKAAERVEAHFAAERDRLARETAQRAEQAVLAAHQERLARARQTHADFDEVINRDDIALSQPMIDAIVHSPVGDEVMYFLGQHPEIAAQLKDLPAGPALVAMGELQAQFRRTPAPAAAPAASAPARAVISSAPPPIRPVSAGTHAPSTSLDDLPLKEYIRRRNEDEANRARRW
jgi:hypothetical protein